MAARDRSLAVVAPFLASQWHPSLNRGRSAATTPVSSSGLVWWLGWCGHAWQESPSRRARTGAGCPVCTGERTRPGINDLATTDPGLAARWDRWAAVRVPELTYGVRTASGEEIVAADAVLTAIHPWHLGTFVDDLDPKLLRSARQRKTSPFSVFGLHGVLDAPMRAKAGSELDKSIWNTMSSPRFSTMVESLDDLRRGRLPRVPVLSGGCPSNVDPSRAPGDGRAVLHLYCLSTYNLADGGPQRWENIKEEAARQLLERVGDFYDGVDPDAVDSLEIVTPLDHERDTSSMVDGDLGGLAMFSNQIGGLRPTPELSQYAVPGAQGLYLTGPFMHPGQGVNGGGRAVAIKMFKDLGLDFSEISRRSPAGFAAVTG